MEKVLLISLLIWLIQKKCDFNLSGYKKNITWDYESSVCPSGRLASLKTSAYLLWRIFLFEFFFFCVFLALVVDLQDLVLYLLWIDGGILLVELLRCGRSKYILMVCGNSSFSDYSKWYLVLISISDVGCNCKSIISITAYIL